MPFTPYHFGPSGFLALAFKKHIDIPVFVLANVIVDLEPLTVILLGPDYPMHGFCHTFLLGSAVGLAWALIAYSGKSFFQRLMKLLHVPYQTNLRKILVSAILGIWFHVLLDGMLYGDIQPFWPLQANPLLDLLSRYTVYFICQILFVPAIALYIIAVKSYIRENKVKKTI